MEAGAPVTGAAGKRVSMTVVRSVLRMRAVERPDLRLSSMACTAATAHNRSAVDGRVDIVLEPRTMARRAAGVPRGFASCKAKRRGKPRAHGEFALLAGAGSRRPSVVRMISTAVAAEQAGCDDACTRRAPWLPTHFDPP